MAVGAGVETTRLRNSAFYAHVAGLGVSRCRDAIEQRRQLLAHELRIPAFLQSDIPVVSFLRNLANLEANHPAPRYPPGGVPDFHIDRVCTDPVREP